MEDRLDRIFKIIPSLSRYALALSGAEAKADDVVVGSINRILADTTPESEGLEHLLIEGCRIEWLEIEQNNFGGISPMQRGQDSLNGMDAIDINLILDNLPTLQRKCLLMSAVDHKPYSEISVTENISTSLVNDYITQARAAFSNMICAKDNALREEQTLSFERYSDRHLNALLDNELGPIEAMRMRSALSYDPQLAKKLEELVLVDTLIMSNLPVADELIVHRSMYAPTAHTSQYLH